LFFSGISQPFPEIYSQWQNWHTLSVEQIVTQCGCNISSNWAVTLTQKPLRQAYFFEINGTYSTLGLTSALTKLKLEIKNSFGQCLNLKSAFSFLLFQIGHNARLHRCLC
jgi:hypothetical protein